MERDVLERLASDRALGGLAPDVERLLDAYVAREPAAARLVEETVQTAELAGRAMRESSPIPIPVFPMAGFAQAARRRWWGRRIGLITSLAACVAVSFCAGRFSTATRPDARPDNGVSTIQIALRSPDANALAGGTEPPDRTSSFWSYESILARMAQARSRPPASPARTPLFRSRLLLPG